MNKKKSIPTWLGPIVGPIVGVYAGLKMANIDTPNAPPAWVFIALGVGMGFVAGFVVMLLDFGKKHDQSKR